MNVKLEQGNLHDEAADSKPTISLSSVDAIESQREEKIKSEATPSEQLQLANSKLEAEVLNLEEAIKHKDAALDSSRRKVSELELQIKAKAGENSDYLMKVQNLEKELAKRIEDHQKMQLEMERSRDHINTHNSDINDLQAKKDELEKQISSGDQENEQLRQELQGRESKLLVLERTLKDRDDKLENIESDKSAQIANLKAEVNRLEELHSKINLEDQVKDNDSLQGKILGLEMMVTKQEDEISALQKMVQDRGKHTSVRISFLNTQLEDLLKKLSNKENVQLGWDDQFLSFQKKLEDKEDEESAQISTLTVQINHLVEELQLKINREKTLQGKISNLETAMTGHQQEASLLREQLEDKERDASAREAALATAITRLNEELANKEKTQEKLAQMENHISEQTKMIADQQRILKQQEDTIFQLRVDCKQIKGRFLQAAERKMDETAEEFRNFFDAKLRILSQRIRVAEQLHGENKDGFKKIQERCEQEHSGIEKKFNEYYELISSNRAAITKVYEAANEMAMTMISLIMKKLEEHMNKEEESGNSLLKAMYELERKVGELQAVVEEKEAGIARLGKEKVEAIKQLSMSIDYHHSRCDRLIEVLSRRRTRSR